MIMDIDDNDSGYLVDMILMVMMSMDVMIIVLLELVMVII